MDTSAGASRSEPVWHCSIENLRTIMAYDGGYNKLWSPPNGVSRGALGWTPTTSVGGGQH
ncbi:arabinose isomerase [Anopheles sinensis]|uniref:Arabinose isomerase n=1 Tax=Anopheles sinensis TaxID=74873 RepID=A0A084W521_ANOSI|nr:arabinose isomerase [Anopheles sinensis]